MPRTLISFGVEPGMDARAMQRALRQYAERRLDAVLGKVAYESAELVREEILSRVTGTPLEDPYRKSLSVDLVSGSGPGKGYAYAVRLRVKASKVTPIEAKTTVLRVVPRSTVMVPPKPEVLILANHGPWTVDTLPFVPGPRDAKVFSSKVSAAEAAAVTAQQKDPTQARKIRTLLDRAGYKVPPASTKIRVTPAVKAIPDIAYKGYQMEFGYGGGQRLPHWRPAVGYLQRVGLGSILKSRTIRDGIGKMRYNAWRQWPPDTAGRVSAQDALGYKPFANKITR